MWKFQICLTNFEIRAKAAMHFEKWLRILLVVRISEETGVVWRGKDWSGDDENGTSPFLPPSSASNSATHISWLALYRLLHFMSYRLVVLLQTCLFWVVAIYICERVSNFRARRCKWAAESTSGMHIGVEVQHDFPHLAEGYLFRTAWIYMQLCTLSMGSFRMCPLLHIQIS